MNPHRISCTQIPCWPPPPETEPFEHHYTVKLSPMWCIQIPYHPGQEYGKINRTRYEWTWSIKRTMYDPAKPVDEKYVETPCPGNSPLMNYTIILNCTTVTGNPTKTWYITEHQTLIRDMCTCWEYPSRCSEIQTRGVTGRGELEELQLGAVFP